jgi:hypothetical protein
MRVRNYLVIRMCSTTLLLIFNQIPVEHTVVLHPTSFEEVLQNSFAVAIVGSEEVF